MCSFATVSISGCQEIIGQLHCCSLAAMEALPVDKFFHSILHIAICIRNQYTVGLFIFKPHLSKLHKKLIPGVIPGRLRYDLLRLWNWFCLWLSRLRLHFWSS